MGFARYDTPLGEAGYGIEDVCNHDDCEVTIDRGLSFLCGPQPGVATEDACGKWFCPDHLGFISGQGQRCAACSESEDQGE